MDKESLITNIVHRCKMRDEPPTKACVNAGVGKSFMSDLRRGQVPSVAKVADLAAYLGVSTSDLVGDAKDPPPADPVDESFARFIAALAALSPSQREAVIRMLEAMSQNQSAPPAAPQ